MPFQCTCEQCGKSFRARSQVKPNRFCSFACKHAPRHLIPGPDGSLLVPLTKGKHAIIDASDADIISPFRWCISGNYAVRSRKRSEPAGVRMIAMHRLLADVSPDRQVDHINGDTLDNRRANLRPATATENKWNFKIHCTNSSGYRGVQWHKHWQRWHAEMHVNGKKVSLGYFHSAEDAARAYDAGVKKYRGQFGRLNFP